MLSTSKLVVDPDWQPLLRAYRLDDVWSLAGEVVKRGNSTEVLRCRLGERTVFLKKHWVTNPNQLLGAITRGALFGRSKVRREFENLRQLRAWGLDAPAPVAYGEQRRAGWLVRSWLLSEAIPDAMPLDAFIVSHLPRQLRRQLIERLAGYARRLHQHRFVHCDLYWRNIILAGHDLSHFNLIDAHNGHSWADPDERAQDLAALDAPAPAFFRRTERLRFFLCYTGHDRLTDDDKALLRQSLALAEPMRERQLRRIREARR